MVQEMSPEQVKRNRWKLIGIFAVAGLPVIAAMMMYFGQLGIPSGSTVKGNLVNPSVPYDLLGGTNTDSSGKSKWRMFVTGRGECETACMDLLHTIRQVHISMGREMNRVERAVVCSECSVSVEGDAIGAESLVRVRVEPGPLAKFSSLAQANGASFSPEQNWTVWVVDPLGNVMLQYAAEHDGYDMIADLKKLLKLSNIG